MRGTTSNGDSRKKSRSRVVMASVNPLWEETLEVLVSVEEVANNILTIRVWDKDLMPGADDLIGRCVLARIDSHWRLAILTRSLLLF